MHSQITARNFEANVHLRRYVDQQIARLTKYHGEITDVHVILGLNANPQREKHAEITLSIDHRLIKATNSASTHEEAINQSIDRIRYQLVRYKARRRTKRQAHESFRYLPPE